MITRRIVLGLAAVAALVLSNANVAEACFRGGCFGGMFGGGFFHKHSCDCCMSDCACGCEESCDDNCGCESEVSDCGCGCGEAVDSSEDKGSEGEAPAAPEEDADANKVEA